LTTLTLKIPEELAEELSAEARLQHLSKSEVARNALARYLQQKKQTPKPSCYDLIKPFVGCVKEGPADLSHNKSHLKGFGR
jgi:metal-responsive CopG/Arc/MetJ family transcriptional regulator